MNEKLKEILATHTNTPSSVFWSAFCESVNSYEKSLNDCLMEFFLDQNAPYPFEKLSPHDQLLAYGLLMAELGRKKLLFEEIPLEHQEKSPIKVDLIHLESRKASFLTKSPWLTEIEEKKAFPAELIPLADGLQFSHIEIQDFLEIAGCTPESLFTIKEWVERYEKKVIAETSSGRLYLEIPMDSALNSIQIKSLVKALENDHTIKTLSLASGLGRGKLGQKEIKILCGELNKFHISTLILSDLDIEEENFKILLETLPKNTSLESLGLWNCGITDQRALNLLKSLKTSHIKELDLAANPISFEANNITDLLADTLKGNTSLQSLNLSSCHIKNRGALALFEALKICSITDLNLASNDGICILSNNFAAFKNALTNNTLRTLDLSGSGIQPSKNFKQLFKDCFEPNTTLVEFELFQKNHLKYQRAREIQEDIDELLSRNKSYCESHRKIDEYLAAVRGAALPKDFQAAVISGENEGSPSTGGNSSSGNSSSQKTPLETTTAHLNDALQEALKLYYAIPRYVHAEKLLHSVYSAIAITYAQYGDYLAFIALYFHHFILHPDSAIAVQLGNLLSTLEKKTYESAGLTSKDMQTLCLSLSINKDRIKPDTLLAKVTEASETHKEQQKLLKKLFVTPFHIAIQSDPNCFKNDPALFLKILDKLSTFEVNLVFSTASDAEISEYFDILKDAWESEEEEEDFLSLNCFSTANWSRFLNQLNLETLSTFNLASLGKISGELRDALADWLIIKLKSPSPEFLAFVREQKLFSIPHLSNLITKDTEIQKELVEYGLFMAKLGDKIRGFEKAYSENEDDIETFQKKLARLEWYKTRFFSGHPLRFVMYNALAFPIELIPILKTQPDINFNLADYSIPDLLRLTECLPPLSLNKWAKKHLYPNTLHKNHLHLDKTAAYPLKLREIREISQILKSDTSLLKLTLPIKNKSRITYLAEGLKSNKTLQTLDLSNSKLDSEKAKILAELLKQNHTICELDLSCSNLSNKAIEILADALKTNRGLKKLVLDKSNLGNTGVMLLAKAFENNKNLTDVSLVNNGIGTEGLKALAETLKKYKRKLNALDLANNNFEVKDAEAFSETLSAEDLSKLKSSLKLEKDAEFLYGLDKHNDYYHALLMESKAITQSTIRRDGWLGQDPKKNKDKSKAIQEINSKITSLLGNLFTTVSPESIQATTLQDIYNFIKDRESIICASTRSDDWLTWFPRGEVDSAPWFNKIIDLFQTYDAELETNYLKTHSPPLTL